MNGQRYRVELFGGPLDGEQRMLDSLPEMITHRHLDESVVYERVKDGRANPWRYQIVRS